MHEALALGNFTVGNILSYTAAGIATGCLYALAALGLVFIFRVSGVLNFGQGAVGMFATFCAYQVSIQWGAPAVLGVLAALVVGAALGYVIERFTIRPLEGKPTVAKVIVTVGWLLALQQVAGIIWGNNAYHQAVRLVSKAGFNLPGIDVVIGYDQLAVIIITVVLALGLAALLRYTTIGLQMRAVADSPSTGKLWGVRVNRITSLSWMTGSVMAAIAGVLITPFINFTPTALTIIVIHALAAALIGNLVSLPLTLVGGIVLGVVENLPRIPFGSVGGIDSAAVFIVILVVLLARAKRLASAVRTV
ncbi:MAG: branched-chain amino acid ABC transporter permease [Actinomycetota bacterium]